MRLIIIIAAVVAVLGLSGGGAFYYFYMRTPASAKAAQAVPAKKPSFVSLKPIVVTLHPSGDSQQMNLYSDSTYLQVGFEFATTNDQALEAFKQMKPAIRGNVLDLLLKQSASIIDNDNQRQQMKNAVLKVVNKTIAGSDPSDTHPPQFGQIYISRFVTQAG